MAPLYDYNRAALVSQLTSWHIALQSYTDVRRGPHSIGSHVRDAAAYVCRAFGRAYTNFDMKAVLEQLAPHLLTVACYDREARFILCFFHWWSDILLTVSHVSFACLISG